MTLSDADILAAAGRLAQRIGVAAPTGLEALAGGKNNRVFRLVFAQGPPRVLKAYFADPRDPRDRLGAEWQFLDYAWRRGVRAIPEPLAQDRDAHLGLYAFVPGEKLAAQALRRAHVDAAIDFIVGVNAAPREPLSLAPGSEACFSLDQHVETVDRRVARLASLDPDAPLGSAAQRFVADRLAPAWAAAKLRLSQDAARLGLRPDAVIAASEIVVSPSDFGFHNALVDAAGSVVFIDFEYAGRDDPAKLVCDFFCQPAIPVPIAHLDHFVGRIVGELGLPDVHRDRCRLLLDAYRIKWICIILNDFLPVGAARRGFADAGARSERCARQLALAQAKIAEVGT